MDRRHFLTGLGSLSIGITGVVGSGALSSTEAQRGMKIKVEDDDRAYLRLIELDSNFAYGTGQELLEFRFDEDFRAETSNDDQGHGVGADSVYEFGQLFAVENQGTNPVQVFGIYEDDTLNDVQLLEYAPNPSDEPLTPSSRSSTIEPGDSVHISMLVDTEAVDIAEYSTTIKIGAAAADSQVFP